MKHLNLLLFASSMMFVAPAYGQNYKQVWADEFNNVGSVDERTWNFEIKPKMLFQLKNAQSISLSDDGRFLTVSYFSENSNGEKSRTKIYNIDTKKFFTVKTKSIKDSALIKNQEKY